MSKNKKGRPDKRRTAFNRSKQQADNLPETQSSQRRLLTYAAGKADTAILIARWDTALARDAIRMARRVFADAQARANWYGKLRAAVRVFAAPPVIGLLIAPGASREGPAMVIARPDSVEIAVRYLVGRAAELTHGSCTPIISDEEFREVVQREIALSSATEGNA